MIVKLGKRRTNPAEEKLLGEGKSLANYEISHVLLDDDKWMEGTSCGGRLRIQIFNSDRS